MTVGFDIDGTITRHPPFFAFLGASLVEAGHRVLIVTFRADRESTQADLEAWAIPYHKLITSTAQSVLEQGVDRWKAAVCRDEKIDVFFEDDPEILQHISPRTFCLMPVDSQHMPPRSGGGGSRR